MQSTKEEHISTRGSYADSSYFSVEASHQLGTDETVVVTGAGVAENLPSL